MLTSKNRAPHIKLWIKNGKPRRTAVNGRVLTDSRKFIPMSGTTVAADVLLFR